MSHCVERSGQITFMPHSEPFIPKIIDESDLKIYAWRLLHLCEQGKLTRESLPFLFDKQDRAIQQIDHGGKNLFYYLLSENGTNQEKYQLETSKFLIENGFSIQYEENLEKSPLLVAVIKLTTVRDLYCENEKKEMAEACYLKIAQLFIEKGAALNSLNGLGKSLLWYASNGYAGRPYLSLCQYLLNMGAKTEWRGDISNSPLAAAMKGYSLANNEEERKDYLRIGELCAKKMRLNDCDDQGKNHFFCIAENPRLLPFCRLLKRNGASPLAGLEHSGLSAIEIAIQKYSDAKTKKSQEAYIKFVKILLENQNDKEEFLQSVADSIQSMIHDLSKEQQNDWFSAFPDFKKRGVLQNQLKILYNLIPPEVDLSKLGLSPFKITGLIFNPSNINSYQTLVLNFFKEGLISFSDEKLKRLIADSLDFLIAPPEDIEEYLKDSEKPILINLGSLDHLSLVWIWKDFFVLVDSGGVNLTKRLFNAETPSVYGFIERSHLSHSFFRKVKKMELSTYHVDNAAYLRNVQKLLKKRLKLSAPFSFASDYQHPNGFNCFSKCLHILFAAMHYHTEIDPDHFFSSESRKELYCPYFNEPEARSFFYLYDNLMPLYAITKTELFNDEAFLSRPIYLPFMKAFLKEIEEGEIWIKAISDLRRMATASFGQKIDLLYCEALRRVKFVIARMESHEQSS